MVLAVYACHNLVGLLGHLLVDVLALLVVFVDVMRLAECRLEVFLHQQVHTHLAVLHASRGIDAWTYLEDDVAHRDVSSAHAADVDNSLQSDVGVLVQLFQSVERQNAVFVGHGNDVCRNAYGTEVEQGYEPREGNAVVLGKRLHELEAHSAAAQMLERIRVVWPFGVQYGGSLRHHVVGNVVVADNKVYTHALGIGNLIDRFYSAVENNDKFNTIFLCIVYSLITHTVSLVIAVGDVVLDVRIELLQKLIHQCNGSATVNIVIAVNHYALLAPHGVVKTVNGNVHVLHQERVQQVSELRTEEAFCRRLGGDSPLNQD